MYEEPKVKYTEWPVIATRDFATGLVAVPIEVEDHEKIYDCHFLAGFFAWQSEGPEKRMKPRNDWAIGTIVDPSN